MAVSNLITLPEYAKGFANEDVRRTVIDMFTQYSDIFEVMPFESLRGSKYTGYREAALPTPVFRAINESSSSGHGTSTQEPVVLRASRSRCACAASFRA